MMELYEKNKKIILIGGIFLVVVLMYWFFFSGPSAAPTVSTNPAAGGLVSEVSASPTNSVAGQDLLITLSKLKSITIDASIFSNPVYLSLVDKSKALAPQPLGTAVGRRNPFSDFGHATGAAVSTTTAQ